jgi:hypothetical protein
VLDYASDYSWIVIADTNTDFISKTKQNLAGLDRAIELAGQYNQDSHHLNLQVSQCPCPNLARPETERTPKSKNSSSLDLIS